MFDWIVNAICIMGIAGLIAIGFVFAMYVVGHILKMVFIAIRVALKWAVGSVKE